MDYLYNPVTNSFEGTTQNTVSLGQVMWHITNKCSLNCSMCFTRKMRCDDKEVSRHDVPMYVSLLKKLGVQKIDLSGGEPLLYKHLPFLVRECAAQSISAKSPQAELERRGILIGSVRTGDYSPASLCRLTVPKIFIMSCAEAIPPSQALKSYSCCCARRDVKTSA